jgi:hypothetical protein
VIVYNDVPIAVDDSESCQNGYFKWLSWHNLPFKKTRPVQEQESWQLGRQLVKITHQGDELVARQAMVPGRIFEEELVVMGYTYPFRNLELFGPKVSFKTSLSFNFGDRPLTHGHVLAIGQLFRYTDRALTQLTAATSPDPASSAFEWIQSAAAFKGQDFDAEIRVEPAGDTLKLQQDGATGSNSGYVFLRPKRGQSIKTLTLTVNSARWPEAHPDVFDLAIAELTCGEPACTKGQRTLFYQPGDTEVKTPLFSKDPNLILGDASADPSTHYLSLGPGGETIVDLDGVLLNRNEHELTLHFRQGECVGSTRLQVFARANEQDRWHRLDRYDFDCDQAHFDLYDVPLAREIRLVYPADKANGKAIDIDAVTCPSETP